MDREDVEDWPDTLHPARVIVPSNPANNMIGFIMYLQSELLVEITTYPSKGLHDEVIHMDIHRPVANRITSTLEMVACPATVPLP